MSTSKSKNYDNDTSYVGPVDRSMYPMSDIKKVLKPCPFCGTEPILTEITPHSHKSGIANFMPDHPGSFTAECPKCSCGMIDANKDSVVRTWNTRAVLAASAPAQEPVAWMITACGEVAFHKERLPISGNWTPLYAAPIDAQDAVDAKRYRWLRDGNDVKGSMFAHTLAHNFYGMEWDAKIDAAMQASQSPQDQETK